MYSDSRVRTSLVLLLVAIIEKSLRPGPGFVYKTPSMDVV